MISQVASLYHLDIKSMISISSKVKKIITDKSYYVLKEVDSLKKEEIYSRIALAKLHSFSLPLKSINGRYVEEINHKYYILNYYYKDDEVEAKELRISFYLKNIAYLHKTINFPLKVNDGFFIESIDFIERKINMIEEEIESRMFNIERQEYHSPSDWYFISSFHIFHNAIKESRRYLDLLNEEFEKLQSVNLSLTYQNYSLDHILTKEEKIISLEKMSFAPSIYDLVDFIEKNYALNLDLSVLLNNYLSINSLESYQIYWLLALLYIPRINKQTEIVKDIESLYNSISYLKVIEKISNLLIQTE